jgi:hypothetical protein
MFPTYFLAALDLEGLLRISGSLPVVESYKDKFDEGKNLKLFNIHKF